MAEKIDMKMLKAHFWQRRENWRTAQSEGQPAPPPTHGVPESGLILLPDPAECPLAKSDIGQAIADRRSRRRLAGSLNQEQLSFLLWATQGSREGNVRFRTVPSAGARHPLETYLALARVEGLAEGIYRYVPEKHGIVLQRPQQLNDQIEKAALGQSFVAAAPAVFFWAAVPYRTSWRYAQASPKLIALDAGHVCQNLYLACEAVGLGTCAIGAYDQDAADSLLELDGENEFTVYLAPVGRPPQNEGERP